MKNISNKAKRLLVTGCLAIICVVLIMAIYSRFQAKPVKNDEIQPSSTVSVEITPTPDTTKPNETAEKKDEVVVKPKDTGISQSGTKSQNPNEVVQSNTPQPVKPTPPEKPKAQGDATNPSKPPEYKPEDTTVTKLSEPKAGEKNEKGEVWFSGFGWVKDSGANQGTTVGNKGDELTGNKVGSMD